MANGSTAASLFLSALFGPTLKIAPELKLYIWTHPNRLSKFFDDTGSAAKFATSGNNKVSNVYFGMCLSNKTTTANRRPTAEMAGALSCLWADIDIAHDVHKKKRLPTSVDQAMEIIEAVRAEPTIIVHSGHGLQAYWVFKEPILIKNATDAQACADLSKNWGDTVRFCASGLGFEADAVHDLARVMRVPGTMNVKQDLHVDVQIYSPQIVGGSFEAGLDLYTEVEIDGFLVPQSFTSAAGAANLLVKVDPVLPNAKAKEPPAIVAIMRENDRRFDLTWKQQRLDLGDSSPSGYDQSIATQLAMAEASDQEIADALFCWRSLHRIDTTKLARRDYIMRTIKNARNAAGKVSAASELLTTTDDPSDIQNPNVAEKNRQKILKNLSNLIGVRVIELAKIGKDQAVYTLKLADGSSVELGRIDGLLELRKFRSAIADATGKVIPGMKADKWHQVVERILGVCVEIESRELDRDAFIHDTLAAYFEVYRVETRRDELAINLQMSQPFIYKGLLHLSAVHLKRWMETRNKDNANRYQLQALLSLAGMKSKKVSLWSRLDKKTVSRSLWVGPTALAAPAPDAEDPEDEDEPVGKSSKIVNIGGGKD